MIHTFYMENEFVNHTANIVRMLIIDFDKEYFDNYLSGEFSNARNFVSGAVMADELILYD